MAIVVRHLTSLALAAALLTGAAAGEERPAPADSFKPFRFKSLEGTRVALTDILGKATLVVFFFPTCQYCSIALPEIQKLHDTYKASGLAVVWINVVPEQDRLLQSWRSEHGYTVPILLGGTAAQRDYSLTMTPTHYLLDSTGRVLSRAGGFKHGDEKDLELRIKNALTADGP
jgi:peroxiredoxin